MSAKGRFLPVATLLSDRLVIGESGHWDASSKSHVYDIRERQQRGRKRTLISLVPQGDSNPCYALMADCMVTYW